MYFLPDFICDWMDDILSVAHLSYINKFRVALDLLFLTLYVTYMTMAY